VDAARVGHVVPVRRPALRLEHGREVEVADPELATGEGAPTEIVTARSEVHVDSRSVVLLKRA